MSQHTNTGGSRTAVTCSAVLPSAPLSLFIFSLAGDHLVCPCATRPPCIFAFCHPPQACGLKAGDFVHTIGDAHVYVNHVDALREQLERKPRPFPTLSINTEQTDIDSFEFKDFEIKGYLPYKTIKMKMAV